MAMNIREVKSVLRSILVSSSVAITVSDLHEDFEELEGISIPFKAMGYDSLLEFLKSIPDVLKVNGNNYGSKVSAVESEKSSHISDLVSRQKYSGKSKNYSRSRRNNAYFEREYDHSSKALRDDEIRTALVDEEHAAWNMADIKRNNRRCDSRKKISCSEQDAIQSEMIEDTKKQKKRQWNGNFYANYASDHFEEKSIQSASFKSLDRLNIDLRLRPGVNQKTTTNRRDLVTKQLSNLKISPKDIEGASNRNKYKDHSEKTDKPPRTRESDRLDTDLRVRLTVDRNKTKDFRVVARKERLEHSPRKIEKYTDRTPNMELPISTEPTSQNFLLENWVTETVNRREKEKRYEARREGSWRMMKQQATSDNSSVKSNEKEEGVPERLQHILRKLISDHPEGLWSADLPSVYKNLTGKELHIKRYGYKSLRFMCLDLEDIFHCITESARDIKLYDAKKPFPKIKVVRERDDKEPEEQEPTIAEPLPAFPEIAWGVFDSFIPGDAVKFGQELQRVQVADVLKLGISVKVVVADIHDISKFWVYLDDAKLETLFAEMQIFYQSNDRYLVPKPLQVVGLHCVVLYGDEFYRAVILKVASDVNLKVYYTDYGTLSTVSRSQVWFLTSEFSKLPTQAIRCRLADVCPPYENTMWSAAANIAFSSLTLLKKLKAKIVRVDVPKNLLEIKLKDSEGSYISDILVERNYAIYLNETQKKIAGSNVEPKVKSIHLFPTFDEIENWLVPSKQEIAEYTGTPVTADFWFPHYFKRTSYSESIDGIETEMKRVESKKFTPMNSFKSRDIARSHSVKEMNDIAYGTSNDRTDTKRGTENWIEEGCAEEVLDWKNLDLVS